MAMLRAPDALATGAASTGLPVITTGTDLCTVCHERPRLGSLARCKACLREAADAARQERAAAEARVKAKAEVKEEAATTKRSKCCALTKSLASFSPHKRSRDGHRHACKPCVRKGRAASKPMSAERAARRKAAAADPAQRAKMRAAVADWRRRNPSAGRARLTLYRALRKGKAQRPAACQIRGCEVAERLVGHHSDYSKPLDVLHICGRHHRQLHGGVELNLKPGVPAHLKRIPQYGSAEGL